MFLEDLTGRKIAGSPGKWADLFLRGIGADLGKALGRQKALIIINCSYMANSIII